MMDEDLKKKIAECFDGTNEARCFKCNKFRLAKKKWNLQLNYEKCKKIFEEEKEHRIKQPK
jgi:hypothetical protein